MLGDSGYTAPAFRSGAGSVGQAPRLATAAAIAAQFLGTRTRDMKYDNIAFYDQWRTYCENNNIETAKKVVGAFKASCPR